MLQSMTATKIRALMSSKNCTQAHLIDSIFHIALKFHVTIIGLFCLKSDAIGSIALQEKN